CKVSLAYLQRCGQLLGTVRMVMIITQQINSDQQNTKHVKSTLPEQSSEAIVKMHNNVQLVFFLRIIQVYLNITIQVYPKSTNYSNIIESKYFYSNLLEAQ